MIRMDYSHVLLILVSVYMVAVGCLLMSAGRYCSLALLFSKPRVTRYFVRFKARIERGMGAALIALGGRLLWAR
ncbi:MAG: Lysine exporter protein [Rhodoferax sp.]|nr:Lysine exporter protein [Rhodoferax sp.]